MPADVFEVYLLLIFIVLSIYFACLKLLALSYVEIRLIRIYFTFLPVCSPLIWKALN